MKHTEHLANFEWVLLHCAPKWNEIDSSCRLLIENGLFERSNHQKLFHAFGYLNDYMHVQRIKEFNEQSKPVADRWTEFFTAMNDVADCHPLDQLVGYVLSIPGI